MKFLYAVIFLVSITYAQPEIPTLKQWATDYTSTLSSGQLETLNYRLKTFEDSTSSQLVMLMIPTLDDYPIEYFTHDVAEKNKIGTKEHDNGALLFIAKNDKKLRIEVGYGLEGVLPDALASSIIRNEIVPYFRKSDFYSGITVGINAIILMFILRGGRRRRGGFIYFGGLGGRGGGFSSGGFGGFSGGGGSFGGGGASGGW
jgi:uncharacterized protein